MLILKKKSTGKKLLLDANTCLFTGSVATSFQEFIAIEKKRIMRETVHLVVVALRLPLAKEGLPEGYSLPINYLGLGLTLSGQA